MANERVREGLIRHNGEEVQSSEQDCSNLSFSLDFRAHPLLHSLRPLRFHSYVSILFKRNLVVVFWLNLVSVPKPEYNVVGLRMCFVCVMQRFYFDLVLFIIRTDQIF